MTMQITRHEFTFFGTERRYQRARGLLRHHMIVVWKIKTKSSIAIRKIALLKLGALTIEVVMDDELSNPGQKKLWY